VTETTTESIDRRAGVGLLDGRVVIVTGGGRGLGRSHCVEMAAHGATVVVNDLGAGLHGEEAGLLSPAGEVVATIEAKGGTAIADGTSVSDHAGMAALVARTVETFGRLDAVVNNAGIIRDRMLTGMSEEDFDQVVAVHLKGTFNLTRHACDHWRAVAKAGGEVSGRIINTTSGTGLFGNVGQANYGAAKAAVANLTVITAMEMDRYGVTANAISPIARTRMTEGVPSMGGDADGAWDRFDPANAAPVVAWLASARSGWLTGAVLRIDGDTVQRVRGWEVDPRVGYRSGRGQRLEAAEMDRGMRVAFGAFPSGVPAGSLVAP
jgi:NAD(P)-dependent dehydrogenase (short-subunit alcohol dehydrogenase family)